MAENMAIQVMVRVVFRRWRFFITRRSDRSAARMSTAVTTRQTSTKERFSFRLAKKFVIMSFFPFRGNKKT